MNRFCIRALILTLCLSLCLGSGLADVLSATPEEYSLPLTDKPITLSYMTCESWTPEYSLADNREIWQQIEKDTGIKIEWNVISGSDYTTVLKTRIAGGDLPDIFWLDASTNPIQLYEDGLTIR
ncbi:MAG: extracellular solute-binding protein [Clostridia bacterium]|nr:extracellular solute-binding protein [Clostridia bacterium]MDD6040248.1 extracellular solute-binding protein [Clostridia bacterium]